MTKRLLMTSSAHMIHAIEMGRSWDCGKSCVPASHDLTDPYEPNLWDVPHSGLDPGLGNSQCPALQRTSSSAVEQPVYTRSVGGSIPSSCTPFLFVRSQPVRMTARSATHRNFLE